MILRPFELQMEHEINLTLCSFYDKLVKLSGPPNNESSPDQMQPPPPPASQVVTSVMKGSGKGSILYSTICILDFVTHKLNKTNTEDPKNDSEGDAAIGVKPIQDYSIKGMLYGAYETLFRSHAAGSEMNVLSNAEAIRDLLQVESGYSYSPHPHPHPLP